MPFQNADQLKKFLTAPQYKCRVKFCPFETNEEEEFSHHVAEHVLIKNEERQRKREVARAKPKQELVNMLGKIINDN